MESLQSKLNKLNYYKENNKKLLLELKSNLESLGVEDVDYEKLKEDPNYITSLIDELETSLSEDIKKIDKILGDE